MIKLTLSAKITTFLCATAAVMGLSGCAPWVTGGCDQAVSVVSPCCPSSCAATYSCYRVNSCAYTGCGANRCGGGCNPNYYSSCNPYGTYPAVY